MDRALKMRLVIKMAGSSAMVALLLTGCASGRLDRLPSLTCAFADGHAAKPPVLVVAHRGCWTDTAENSLASIERCIAMGVDMVELDVRRTADGVLVLMHDESVDRTTNGRGKVGELRFEQIARLRLRAGAGGPGAPLTSEAPPTFEAAMRAARGRVMVNLDAKADVYADAFRVLEKTGTVRQVVMKRRVAPGEAPLTSQPPFDRVMAMPIIDQTRGSPEALLAEQFVSAPQAIEVIFTDFAYLSEVARRSRERGVRIWVNTLRPDHAAGLVDGDAVADPQRVWGRLIDAGVSILQTDAPSALLAYRDQIGRRPSSENCLAPYRAQSQAAAGG